MAKQILVVDDEASIVSILETKLTGEGFTVMTASDGTQGLARALEHHPDLILLDILMPKMNGIQMLKQLRQDPWGKTVPVILLTVLNPDDELLREIVSYEPTYYLVKSSWKLDDVVMKVREYLGNR